MANEQEFPKRVTLGEDQVYRWYYDMDMYHNHYFRNILLIAFGLTGVLCGAAMLFGFSAGGRLTTWTALISVLVCAGIELLALAGYYLAAVFMHGVYRLRFAMGEDAVMLVRKQSTQKMLNIMPFLTLASGAAAGNALKGVPLATAQNAAAGSGFTYFKNVRKVKELPKYDIINLRGFAEANQLWVCPEDYAFVLDYIKSRIPERARH